MERIALEDRDVAYLVGCNGSTRIRIENFSHARINIDRDAAEVRPPAWFFARLCHFHFSYSAV